MDLKSEHIDTALENIVCSAIHINLAWIDNGNGNNLQGILSLLRFSLLLWIITDSNTELGIKFKCIYLITHGHRLWKCQGEHEHATKIQITPYIIRNVHSDCLYITMVNISGRPDHKFRIKYCSSSPYKYAYEKKIILVWNKACMMTVI